MRGGPEKWHISGWLQIINMKKHHEGDYMCIAQNEHGSAQASARINVVTDKGLYTAMYVSGLFNTKDFFI